MCSYTHLFRPAVGVLRAWGPAGRSPRTTPIPATEKREGTVGQARGRGPLPAREGIHRQRVLTAAPPSPAVATGRWCCSASATLIDSFGGMSSPPMPPPPFKPLPPAHAPPPPGADSDSDEESLPPPP